jgi:hypothetical protein
MMEMSKQRSVIQEHKGPILEPSKGEFDAGGATWGCAYVDEEDPGTTFLYYSGMRDTSWSHSAIGLAVSEDGEHFRKETKLNPIIDGEKNQFNARQSVTPAVVRVGNHYYMLFAGSCHIFPEHSYDLWHGRRIAIACADDPRGPWRILKIVAKPDLRWEGWSIDLGPGVAKLSQDEILVYYSNVNCKNPLSIRFPRRYLRRSLGILRLKIRSPSSITCQKYFGNPLKHLNGVRGSPGESVFCPGYLLLKDRHFLVPGMSTYSVASSPPQYIGLITGESPYFSDGADPVSILVDGSAERTSILNTESQIGLDTPSPIVKEDTVYLYFAAVDRSNQVWKTCLTTLSMSAFQNVRATEK